MGIKGDKEKKASALSADKLLKELDLISGITSKKMFGGHGIFHEGNMFGMVDSSGYRFLKADDTIRDIFEQAGSKKHGRMPYYSIPAEADLGALSLVELARKSIEISK